MSESLSVGEISKTLVEALPYIRQLYGETIVVKFGGNVSSSEEKLDNVAKDVVLLKLVGMNPVIVHGGGDEISRFMKKMNMEPRFVDGLRVTDEETMDIVEMVLGGRVNKAIVCALEKQGGRSVGLSGKDGRLIQARVKDPKLGRVGIVESLNVDVVDRLSEAGFIPVIAPVGMDSEGGSLNINADTLAGDLAARLGAEKYVVLTDVQGILRDPDDGATLISSLSLEEAKNLIGDGTIAGGMLPKVESCVRALEGQVNRAHVLNGDTPHSLVLELLTDKGIGTMIKGQ
jgi:acetylglutamate kinase